MAGGSVFTRLSDGVAGAFYAFRHSPFARFVFVVLMLAAVGSAVFSRPKQLENLTVTNYSLRDIGIASAGQYVRVSGMYEPDEAYQRYLRLTALYSRSFGTQFVVLAEPGSGVVLPVLAQDLPALERNAAATLVGYIEIGTGELPPFYLVVGDPPNVRLANLLARVGLGVMAGGALLLLLLFVIHQLNYALPALWQRSPEVVDAPSLMWFGELGRQYSDVVLRGEESRFVAGIHEVRIEPSKPQRGWSVSIRRVRQAELFDLATSRGPVPAVRLKFEDERGLIRRGVLATDSVAARDAMLSVFALIRS